MTKKNMPNGRPSPATLSHSYRDSQTFRPAKTPLQLEARVVGPCLLQWTGFPDRAGADTTVYTPFLLTQFTQPPEKEDQKNKECAGDH